MRDSHAQGFTDDRFAAIVDRCGAQLWRFVQRRADSNDVGEIVNDALTIGWQKLASIDQGLELAFLYGVARRLIANRHRGNRRRGAVLAKLTIADRSALAVTEDIAGKGELSPAVRQMWLGLGPADREILLLIAWEELTVKEIGIVLEIREAAARKRVQRARARARDLYEMTTLEGKDG